MQDSVSPPCWVSSLLSGWARGGLNLQMKKYFKQKYLGNIENILMIFTHPPVADQSWKADLLSVGASLAWLADQNHPLMFLGKKSGRSQPSKSHRRPEVQK